MRRARLNSLIDHGLGIDTETYAIRLGVLAPPIVCGSIGWVTGGPGTEGRLLDREDALEAFTRALTDPDIVLVGANIAFDLAVYVVEEAKRGRDRMSIIFDAFVEQRVYDIQIAEALHAIAEGCLGKDPRTGGELINPETGRRGRYSLSMCVDLVLGRQDAKANDEWRLRYGELDGVPIELWPAAARDYPVDDARNTIEVGAAQCGLLPKTVPYHNWSGSACADCGATRLGTGCVIHRAHRNLHDLADQVWTSFVLHLGALYGFRVNQDWVDVIERHYLRSRKKYSAPFVEIGLLREDLTENRALLKKMIAIAHGASEPCATCAGTGKVQSPKAKIMRCRECRGKQGAVEHCAACGGVGKYRDPKHLVVCHVGDPDDPDAKTKTCDGTGLVLDDDVPRSEKEGISYGKDTCHESGDDTLIGYGDYLEDQKIPTYIAFLRRGRVPVGGHREECPIRDEERKGKRVVCTCPGPWLDVPLTLMPNNPLETGRVSYGGSIQQFMRKLGFLDKETGEYIPSLRECIQARGAMYERVWMPTGYVLKTGERYAA